MGGGVWHQLKVFYRCSRRPEGGGEGGSAGGEIVIDGVRRRRGARVRVGGAPGRVRNRGSEKRVEYIRRDSHPRGTARSAQIPGVYVGEDSLHMAATLIWRFGGDLGCGVGGGVRLRSVETPSGKGEEIFAAT